MAGLEKEQAAQVPLAMGGVVLAVMGTFLFALKSIFIKFAYLEGASAELVILLRMLMAAPFYVVVLFFLLRKRGDGRGGGLSMGACLRMLGLGFLGYYLASYLDLLGLEYISAQLERLTLFTYPTMIAILAAIFLGEKLTGWIAASLFLCYAGLWLMYGQEVHYAEGEKGGRGCCWFWHLPSAIPFTSFSPSR